MPEPANIREPYNIDMEQLRSGIEAVIDSPAEQLAGVQLINPQVEKFADLVADAVVAAAAAQETQGATPESVRSAVRSAVSETA